MSSASYVFPSLGGVEAKERLCQITKDCKVLFGALGKESWFQETMYQHLEQLFGEFIRGLQPDLSNIEDFLFNRPSQEENLTPRLLDPVSITWQRIYIRNKERSLQQSRADIDIPAQARAVCTVPLTSTVPVQPPVVTQARRRIFNIF